MQILGARNHKYGPRSKLDLEIANRAYNFYKCKFQKPESALKPKLEKIQKPLIIGTKSNSRGPQLLNIGLAENQNLCGLQKHFGH